VILREHVIQHTFGFTNGKIQVISIIVFSHGAFLERVFPDNIVISKDKR
jgi:hypothetical protein